MTASASKSQAQSPARDGFLIRRVAARLRAGEPVDAPADVIAAARTYLEHRATYDKRRATVRALAADVRAGKNPRIPAEFAGAVQRHLAYRKWYNAQRCAERAASKPPQKPARRVDRRILGRRRALAPPPATRR